MRLVIDFDEAMLSEIINSTIRRLMKFGDFSSGEMAQYVESRTREALSETLYNTDFNGMIKEVVTQYSKGIIEHVVKEELKKIAKQAVKELKERGELLEQ